MVRGSLLVLHFPCVALLDMLEDVLFSPCLSLLMIAFNGQSDFR